MTSFERFVKAYGNDPDNMLDVLKEWPINPQWYTEMFPNCSYTFPWLEKDSLGFIVNRHGSYKQYVTYDTFDLSGHVVHDLKLVRDFELEDVVFGHDLTTLAIDLDDSPRSSRLFRMCESKIYPASVKHTVLYDVMYYSDWLFKMVWRYLLHTVFHLFGDAGEDDFLISKTPGEDGMYHIKPAKRRDGFTALSNLVRLFALRHGTQQVEEWKENFRRFRDSYADHRSAIHLEFPHVEFEIDMGSNVVHILPFSPQVCVHFVGDHATTPYPENGPLNVMKLFFEEFYHKLREFFPVYARLENAYRMMIVNRVILNKTCHDISDMVPVEDHADSVALQGGLRLFPRTLKPLPTVIQPPPSPPPADTVVNVKVVRRSLAGVPVAVGAIAHSALLLTTRNGQRHIVEYLADSKVHVTNVSDSNLSSVWAEQAVGQVPDRAFSVDDVRTIMDTHTKGEKYNVHTHNCHLSQQRTRKAMGLRVENPYNPLF